MELDKILTRIILALYLIATVADAACDCGMPKLIAKLEKTTLTSPGFPTYCATDNTCTWDIVANQRDGGFTVVLELEEFQMGDELDCSTNYITLTQMNGTTKRFCGTTFVKTNKAKQFSLTLSTTNMQNYKGFRAVYYEETDDGSFLVPMIVGSIFGVVIAMLLLAVLIHTFVTRKK